MRTYICSYRMDGDSWCLYLKAESQADAERRLSHVRLACTVDGELMASFPASPISGPLSRTVCFIANLFRK